MSLQFDEFFLTNSNFAQNDIFTQTFHLKLAGTPSILSILALKFKLALLAYFNRKIRESLFTFQLSNGDNLTFQFDEFFDNGFLSKLNFWTNIDPCMHLYQVPTFKAYFHRKIRESLFTSQQWRSSFNLTNLANTDAEKNNLACTFIMYLKIPRMQGQ